MNSLNYNSMKHGHIIKYYNVSIFRMAHIASCLQKLLPFVNDNSLFMRIWQKWGYPCPMETFLVFTTYCADVCLTEKLTGQVPTLLVALLNLYIKT